MRAGGLGGGPCQIEESKRKHLPVSLAGSPTKPLTRAVGRQRGNMTHSKENNPKIPPELYETIIRVVTGDHWVKDKPNILSAESLVKIEAALEQGVVFGHHCHYYGGCSLDKWAFLDSKLFKEYVSQSRPGDLYIAWSVKDLEEKNLLLAHGRSSSDTQSESLLISVEDLQHVRQYLSVENNEIINLYISWDTRTVAIHDGDIECFEDLEGEIREHSHPNSEIYVFPLTDIDKPEHYLLQAKYPNDKGEVPIGGAY